MSQKFEIIYNGSIAKGFEADQVKQNVARLYKTEVARIERLFCGELVVIKTDLEREAALKYQAAMKKAGAEVAIRPKQAEAIRDTAATSPASPPPQKPAPVNPASQAVTTPASSPPAATDDSGITMAEPGAQIIEHKVVPEPDINISGISMAEVGADVTDSVEIVAAPIPDTSMMSMADAGVQLVEHEPMPELDIDISNISMAEVGADVADPVVIEAAPLPDISAMSMAEPGTQLSEHQQVPEPDIDISALKMEPDV